MKNQTFHEWREVKEVSEALPTFTTSDIGHFFIVGGWGETSIDSQLARFRYALSGEEREAGGPYLPGMGAGEVLSEGDGETSPRGSL